MKNDSVWLSVWSESNHISQVTGRLIFFVFFCLFVCLNENMYSDDLMWFIYLYIHVLFIHIGIQEIQCGKYKSYHMYRRMFHPWYRFYHSIIQAQDSRFQHDAKKVEGSCSSTIGAKPRVWGRDKGRRKRSPISCVSIQGGSFSQTIRLASKGLRGRQLWSDTTLLFWGWVKDMVWAERFRNLEYPRICVMTRR